jgi:hypothetical protein
MRKLLISLALALTLVLSFNLPAFAATSQDVTVTATPSYIAISNSPNTWTINGISGTGKIQPNTTYYAKGSTNETTPPSATVLDAECYFTVTNSSSVNIDLTVTWGAFTGGGADMTNSNAGTNGATTYGAYCWYSGMTYTSKVIVKSTGSDKMLTGMTPATTTKKWGVEIKTRTDAWTSGTSSTSTLTITATAS